MWKSTQHEHLEMLMNKDMIDLSRRTNFVAKFSVDQVIKYKCRKELMNKL